MIALPLLLLLLAKTTTPTLYAPHDPTLYRQNYESSFSRDGAMCLQNGSNFVMSRGDGHGFQGIYALPESRPWSLSSSSYPATDVDNIQYPICQTMQDLLASAAGGRRVVLTNVTSIFYPHRCLYKWYSSNQVCQILSSVELIHIGDSMMRHAVQTIVAHAAGDYIRGCLPRHTANADMYKKCTCDGQLSENLLCRSSTHLLLDMPNSHSYGICALAEPFEIAQGLENERIKPMSWEVPKNFCKDSPRPRVILMHFGLWFYLDPDLGIKSLNHFLDAANAAHKGCKAQFELHLIFFAVHHEHPNAQLMWPKQAPDKIHQYNSKLAAEIATFRGRNESAMNVTFLNTSEVTRNGAFSDGVHLVFEPASIAVMYILNLVEKIAHVDVLW